MNRTICGIFGFILLLTAIALPFLHLEQAKGDVLPLLIAFLTVLGSGAFFVLAVKPEVLKKYLIAVGALLVLLFAIGIAGFFTGVRIRAADSAEASTPPPPTRIEINPAAPAPVHAVPSQR
jgi:hypothetical protein